MLRKGNYIGWHDEETPIASITKSLVPLPLHRTVKDNGKSSRADPAGLRLSSKEFTSLELWVRCLRAVTTGGALAIR